MVLLQKLTARVFGVTRGIGGNPVTIFLPAAGSNDILPPALEQSLAKSCEWESVLISPSASASASTLPQLKFFVPSGNELSFCAHAAMGAAYVIQGVQASQSDGSITGSNTVTFQTSDGDQQTAHIHHDDDTVFLNLKSVSYEEIPVPLVNTEAILDQVGLDMTHVLNLPLNAAVAGRPKTLVQVALDVLQDETQSAPASAPAFRDNCLLAKQSTGLYLYADTTTGEANSIVSLECRQFPSDSGYPEDPATGIAAAALAVRLSRQPKYQDTSAFRIAQGTAMGRPSRITIQNIEFQQGSEKGVVSLQCGGRVEIDEREEIQV